MPWFVNDQPVPEELIRQEEALIARHPGWLQIADEAERARAIRKTAEQSAIDKVLITQLAAADPRPIDPQLIAQHLPRFLSAHPNGAFDAPTACRAIEQELRRDRFIQEMTAAAPEPTAEEIEAVYQKNGHNFLGPERFHASHIVKHVTDQQSEEQAEAGIAVALAELERGEPFAEVARRHSDCPDQAGELPKFTIPGEMLEEFEEAILALEPGQRTGVFTTPLGFHIAVLHEKIPPGPAPFEDCLQDIQNVLAFQNRHAYYLRGIAELRSRADIRFAPDEPVTQPEQSATPENPTSATS